MRRFACLALALMTLLGVVACSQAPSDAYDNPMHNNYPGPAPRDRDL